MSKTLRLIKAKFCRDKKIDFTDEMPIQVIRLNPKSGNYQFLINGSLYEYERIDLSLYTGYKGLDLDQSERNNGAAFTKESVASWFNRFTNLSLTTEDIGQVLVTFDKVAVIASANSMRFKSSFSMRFK